MYGKDFQYANTRLQETVVSFLDGTPVFIWGVNEYGMAKYSLLHNLDIVAQAPYEALDLTPVRLGYVNVDKRTTYLVRKPMRNDWRQGTRFQQMQSFGQLLVNQVKYSDLFDTIVGRYPKVKEVVDTVANGKVHGLAFNRHWALLGTTLCHRHQAVGDLIGGKLVLHKSFNYLKETLEEIEQ